jgi:hypothetical protein
LRWRASLDEPRRLQFNHSDSVWSHWKRSTAFTPSHCADPRPRQWTGGGNAAVGGGRSISFDQDMVRRAAIAIGENWSNDTFKLAAVALRAAIRNETDLLALLPAAAPATPQRSVEKAGAAVI